MRRVRRGRGRDDGADIGVDLEQRFRGHDEPADHATCDDHAADDSNGDDDGATDDCRSDDCAADDCRSDQCRSDDVTTNDESPAAADRSAPAAAAASDRPSVAAH